MSVQTIEKPTITVTRPPNPHLPAVANGEEPKVEALPPKQAVSQGALTVPGRNSTMLRRTATAVPTRARKITAAHANRTSARFAFMTWNSESCSSTRS